MDGKERSGDQDLKSHNNEVQLLKLLHRDHQAARRIMLQMWETIVIE